LFVRASDGTAWGPAAVGSLYVDRTAPAITGIQANVLAIRVANQPVTVDFSVLDDFSTRFTGFFQIAPAAGPSANKPVCCSQLETGIVQGAQRWTWLPGPEIPAGVYRITMVVADEALNGRKVQLSGDVVIV
jgi:hypothetical protein